MTRALVQWVRDTDGDFTAFAVWHGTSTSLSSLVRPGHPLQGLVARIHETARPPFLDAGSTRGTWEDFIGYAPDALANGHDLMASEVPPESTLERSCARWILGLSGAALERWRPSWPSTVTLRPVYEPVVPAVQAAWMSRDARRLGAGGRTEPEAVLSGCSPRRRGRPSG